MLQQFSYSMETSLSAQSLCRPPTHTFTPSPFYSSHVCINTPRVLPHICTLGQLTYKPHIFMIFGCGKKLDHLGETHRLYRENMQTPHRQHPRVRMEPGGVSQQLHVLYWSASCVLIVAFIQQSISPFCVLRIFIVLWF